MQHARPLQGQGGVEAGLVSWTSRHARNRRRRRQPLAAAAVAHRSEGRLELCSGDLGLDAEHVIQALLLLPVVHCRAAEGPGGGSRWPQPQQLLRCRQPLQQSWAHGNIAASVNLLSDDELGGVELQGEGSRPRSILMKARLSCCPQLHSDHRHQLVGGSPDALSFGLCDLTSVRPLPCLCPHCPQLSRRRHGAAALAQRTPRATNSS